MVDDLVSALESMPNTPAVKRQMSRQISRLSTQADLLKGLDGSTAETDRLKLLRRLMQLSMPELPQIIIGIHTTL